MKKSHFIFFLLLLGVVFAIIWTLHFLEDQRAYDKEDVERVVCTDNQVDTLGTDEVECSGEMSTAEECSRSSSRGGRSAYTGSNYGGEDEDEYWDEYEEEEAEHPGTAPDDGMFGFDYWDDEDDAYEMDRNQSDAYPDDW